jgi:hypothetical protein
VREGIFKIIDKRQMRSHDHAILLSICFAVIPAVQTTLCPERLRNGKTLPKPIAIRWPFY